MKRVCFFIIALLASIASLYAQSEVKGDSVRSLPDGTPPDGVFLPETKNYNGFLLDMSLMKMEAPRLPEFTLEIPDASKDYSSIFRLNPVIIYPCPLASLSARAFECILTDQFHRLQHESVRADRILVVTGESADGQLQTEKRYAYQYLWRI